MEATPTQIINYFSGFKQNLVPLFQRPYTWGERQWRTLWEDIVTFYGREINDPKSTHFLGAVVTMPARSVPVGVSKFLVIDGRQRLTTIVTLLCAIRDEFGSTDSVPKRRIQNHYLTNDGFEGLDVFKLLPTQGDRPTYSELVKNSGNELPDSQFIWDRGLAAAEMKRCRWVKVMICQIKFTEWTRDDRLRQPVFVGLREDKKANEVVREKVS